ncbi:MAG: hypothetical protein CM1200mP30_13350 [Pseudomonadota bacterium]|nr:MAG: hypothetical protein CM1200mP30_13350 [Pseudomonadota bacterium]
MADLNIGSMVVEVNGVGSPVLWSMVWEGIQIVSIP